MVLREINYVFVVTTATIVANTCPCVRNEIERTDRCHFSKLNLFCRYSRPDYGVISFPEPLRDFSFSLSLISFTISLFPCSLVRSRDLDSHFANGRSLLNGTKQRTRRKREKDKGKKKEGQNESGCEVARKRREEKRERPKDRWRRERGREKESSRIVPALRPGF